MATQEFYIRNETDTEARGPFTIEQLSSLIDSSQVTPATLYYDANAEEWVPIDQDSELKLVLFPEKKKLGFRSTPQMEPLNKNQGPSAPIMISDMLAAAEGRTAETRGSKDPQLAMARAAGIGRWGAIFALIIAAAGELLPSATLIMEMDPLKIVAEPLILLGALDLFIAVILALGVVAFYPFVRFRAALGLGFLGFIFFTNGQSDMVLALAAGSIGLYCCTAFVSLVPVILSTLLAAAGFAFVSWSLMS